LIAPEYAAQIIGRSRPFAAADGAVESLLWHQYESVRCWAELHRNNVPGTFFRHLFPAPFSGTFFRGILNHLSV
jgi:hypothetical protein